MSPFVPEYWAGEARGLDRTRPLRVELAGVSQSLPVRVSLAEGRPSGFASVCQGSEALSPFVPEYWAGEARGLDLRPSRVRRSRFGVTNLEPGWVD